MISLIVFEVILRKLFNTSTKMCDEYTGYFQATIIFLTLAACLREKRHIRVDLILRALSPAARGMFEIVTYLISLVFVSVAIWAVGKLVVDSFLLKATSYSPANTLLVIPQSVVLIGLIIFFMQFCVDIYELVRGLRPGKEYEAEISPRV